MGIQEVGDGEMSPGPGQETGAHTQKPPQHGRATVRAVPTRPAEHIYPIVSFCPRLVACGILVPQPGFEPTEVEGRLGLPATGPPGKSPHLSFVNISFRLFS